MFVVAMVLIVGVATLFTQRMRMTPQEATDQLTKDLELTKAQQPKVLDLLTKADTERKKAMEAAEGDREAARPAMMKIRDETNAKLKEILTKDQWTKYEKMQAERRAQQGGPGGPPQQPPPK
jgi:ribosome recycling factor